MAAIIQNLGDYAEDTAGAAYQAALTDAGSEQLLFDATFAKYDVDPEATDPDLSFALQTPTNSKDAEIYGFETALVIAVTVTNSTTQSLKVILASITAQTQMKINLHYLV